MSRIRSLLFILAFLAVVIQLPAPVIAQQAPGGITVTPGVIKTKVSKELPIQQTTVMIRNNYTVPVRLAAELKGIDDSSARIIPGGDLEAALQSSLTLSETDILIPPLSDAQITVQATYADSLRPGGHYATLVLSEQSASKNMLTVRSAVSITIFLTNQEGVSEQFTLNEFSTNATLFALPKTAKVSLKNDGNVHSVPRGVVKLESSGKQILAQGILNAGSSPVLPGKSFENTVALQGMKSTLWPQKITVVLQFHGETSSQASEATKTIWYVPPAFLAIAAVFLLFLGIVFKSRKRLLHEFKALRKSFLSSRSSKKRAQEPKQIHDIIQVPKNRGGK